MNTYCILSYLVLFCIIVSSKKYKLSISSTSPVALDTPIWFNAEIFPGENKNYSFHWTDNTGFSNIIIAEGPRTNWSILYPSMRYEDRIGEKTVTVKVYTADSFHYFTPLARGSITYILNERISGSIQVSQPNVTGIKDGCISTLNVTNITTHLHDPFHWIRDRTEKVTYYYNINNKDNSSIHMVVGPCRSPSVLVNITEPGRYIIGVAVILVVSNNPTTTTIAPTTTMTTTAHTNITTTTTSVHIANSTPKPANTSKVTPMTEEYQTLRDYQCGGDWIFQQSDNSSLMSDQTKYTFAYASVDAAEPLSILNVSGSTWIKHSIMLDLHIECNGTGPYSYCFNITHGVFNKSDPKVCTHQRINTNVCDFTIHYYLTQNGTYSLVLAMDNDVSSRVERHALHVYNTDKEKQLTYIIVPMTCTIIALLMIIFGIARYVQNKNRLSIEVADFDFGASDEHVYKPFLQQLRDAITSSCTANFEDRPKRRCVEKPRILEDDE